MMKFSPFAFIVALFFLVPSAVQADAYTIEEIQVDVTARNAVQARERAIENAHIQAFAVLVDRLAAEGDTSLIPELSAHEIMSLVRDFEIRDERLSSTRYIANFTIRFSEKGIRETFYQSDVRYTDFKGTKPVLLLPVYVHGSNLLLWEEPNPWRQAWNVRAGREKELVPILIPSGDLEDMRDVQGQSVLATPPGNFMSLIGRYDADDIFLALAQPDNYNPALMQQIIVSIYGTDGSSVHRIKQMTVIGHGSTLYAQAVQEVRNLIQTNTKTQVLSNNVTQTLRVVARPVSLAEWSRMQEMLRKVSDTVVYDVVAMRPKQVILDLRFSGQEENVISALQGAMMDLRPSSSLSPTGVPLYRELIFIGR